MNYFLLVGLIGFASGCTLQRQTIILTAVGPPPSFVENRSPNGRLVVYTAFDIHGGTTDIDQLYHSNYRIYSTDGKLLKHVYNKVRTYIEDPATVSLPAGKYQVEATAAAFGPVTVPVVIEPGKTTFVHLDGSELTGAQASAGNFVSLPDGLVIGWCAKDETETK